jgi:predicted RecB family nuclease
MQIHDRTLRDLAGVGPRIESDFRSLGISSVEALADANPDELYDELCHKTGTRQDPCVLDTFRCAVAQARDPRLPVEQRSWWWWSRRRKEGRLTQSQL